jgi:hypothetical protein
LKKVHSRKDLELALSIPLLGDIPEIVISQERGRRRQIVVHENGRDSVSEAFPHNPYKSDILRVKRKIAGVMFTSSNSGAG